MKSSPNLDVLNYSLNCLQSQKCLAGSLLQRDHQVSQISPIFHQLSKFHQVLEILPSFHQVFTRFSPGLGNFTRFSASLHQVSPHQVSRRQLVSKETVFPFHVIAKNVRSVLLVRPKAQNASLEPNIGGSLGAP